MLRVKGQDGFLPLGPELVPAGEFDPTDFTLRTHPQRRGRPGGARPSDLHLGRRLPARRPVAADHARARATSSSPARRRNSRPMEPGDVVAVEIDGLGRAREHRRRLGRRPVGAGRAARDLRQHPARRARRSPRRRPSAWSRREPPDDPKVHVDMNLCQSHGECVYVAPDVFELGDDDVLRLEGGRRRPQRARAARRPSTPAR